MLKLCKYEFLVVIFIGFFISIQTCWASELHEAAKAGNLSKVKELVSKRFKVDELDSEPQTEYQWPKGSALHWASKAGQEDIVKFLIENGADVNIRNDAAECLIVETPLDYAVWGKHKKIIILLLNAGASPESARHVFHWPLQSAAELGAIDIMEMLLNHGANINRSGVDGYTALHSAIWKKQKKAVEFLLNKGADPNFMDKKRSNQTILELAIKVGDKDIIELLKQHGAK